MQDEVNQEESEVDGMKKGANSTVKAGDAYEKERWC